MVAIAGKFESARKHSSSCIDMRPDGVLISACERVAAIANHARIRRSNAGVAGRYGNGTAAQIDAPGPAPPQRAAPGPAGVRARYRMFGVGNTSNDGRVSSPIEVPEDIFERVSTLCLALPEVTARVDLASRP